MKKLLVMHISEDDSEIGSKAVQYIEVSGCSSLLRDWGECVVSFCEGVVSSC